MHTTKKNDFGVSTPIGNAIVQIILISGIIVIHVFYFRGIIICNNPGALQFNNQVFNFDMVFVI